MIVITTPTGRIGRQVLNTVLDSAEAIRVIVRDPSRLDPKIQERVEVVQGSHDDIAVVTRAFAGADSVFWLVPPNPHATSVEDYYLDFIHPASEAIKSQGVKRITVVSTLGRGTAIKNAGLLSAALATEELIENTGVSCRVLRMPFFMENLLGQAQSIKNQGIFSLANAAGRKLHTVATPDIAAVGAKLLLDDSWSGQESVPVVGPDDLSPTDMAQIMSEVLQRPVRFHQLTSEVYKKTLMQRGTSEAWAQGMVDMALAQDKGIYDTALDTLHTTALTSFRQWCEDVLRPAVLASRTREVREGFAHLHVVDQVLATLIDKRPEYEADAWRRELPFMDLFGCLLSQIIGQQISLKAARSILERLMSKFAGHVPGAKEVATLDEQTLRDLGLSWRKAKTVLELATRFTDGRLSEERLSHLPDDRILNELTQISGIGPWTVHGALLIALHRADVVPVGDILLRNTIKTYYNLDHVPTEQEVRDIAAVWRPYGSLGVNLLFAAAELD